MNKKASSRKYAGQSESERIKERRDKFLTAGLELFGTVGLKGTKVRLLCKEAGLTERYFYESFKSVEALFCDVYQQQFIQIQTLFAEELPKLPEDIDERTKAALTLYFDIIKDERLVRVLLLECMTGSELVQTMHQTSTRQYSKIAAQFIRIDNPNILLSDDVLEHTASAINGAVTTLACQWMLEGYKTPQAIIIESALIVVKGIMAELRKH